MLEKNIIAKYDLNNYLYEQIEYFKNNKKEFCDMFDIENTDDKSIEQHFYSDDFESDLWGGKIKREKQYREMYKKWIRQ